MVSRLVGSDMAGSWKGRWYGGMSLAALALVVAVSGLFSLPVVDRDEARFAQASRQMLEAATLPADRLDPALHAGGLAVPMLGDRPRLNKPPLIYWLQAASVWVLTGGDVMRDAIWMYRVPSAIALIVIVLMTWRIGIEMFGWPTGYLAACMMAVSPVFVWEAHQARADMVLVACTIVAMWGLWGVWERRCDDSTERRRASRRNGATDRRGSWGRVLALWLGVGSGVLVKGPITPMVVVLTALMLSVMARRWRWLAGARPLLGLLIVVSMVLPWVWAVGAQVGWGEYAAIVIDETLGRSAAPKEGHWGPPGYHLLFMLVLFWPGVMLTGVAFVRAVGKGMGRRSHDTSTRRRGVLARAWRWVWDREIGGAPEAFCVAWIVPTWIVFELVSTKLPHYTMPLYPALALISARGVHWAMSGAMPAATARWPRIGQYLWAAFPAIIGVASIATALVGIDVGFVLVAFLFGLASLAACVVLMDKVRQRRLLAASRLGIGYGVMFSVVMVGVAMPGFDFIWPTRSLDRAIRDIDPDGTRPKAIMGYREDSLRFLFRGEPTYIELGAGDAWLRAHPDGILVEFGVGARVERDGAEFVDVIHGFNLGGGDHVMLGVWERSP